MIAIVVAHSRNRVIGRDGTLPWHLPSDLRRFRELTTGHAVVMGRRTYDSLPDQFRPLPRRRNIVLSADPSRRGEGETFATLDGALDACERECFVIGGGLTYEQALPLTDRVYATEIDADHAGDAYFPELPADAWRRIDESAPLTENGHRFRFVVYERAKADADAL